MKSSTESRVFQVNRTIFLAIATLTILTFVVPASAAIQVTLGARGLTTIITDNVGPDTNGASNFIDFASVTVGGVTFSGHSSFSNSTGSAGLAFVVSGTNSVTVGTNPGPPADPDPSTVFVYVSSTPFDTPTGAGSAALSSATFKLLPPTGSNPGGDVSYKALVDATGALTSTPTGTVVGSDGPVTLLFPVVVSAQSDVMFPIVLPAAGYALNLYMQATEIVAGSAFDFDGSVELYGAERIPFVPEPASITMWSLISGIGLVAAARKRRAVMSA